MFEYLIELHPKEKKIREIWDKTFLFSDKNNIQNDLCMRNLIQSCISFENPKAMFQTANRYLNHLFELPSGMHQKNMLAGMIDQILNLDSTLDGFSKFFSSNTYNDVKTTSFIDQTDEVVYAYQYIPSNGSDNLLINFMTAEKQIKNGQRLRNMNITSETIDFIMQEDKEDEGEKSVPVKHFLIDFRFIMLKPQLEYINGTHENETEKYDIVMIESTGYTSFRLANFLCAVNEVYG
jgi:hypothetical protein